MSTFTNTAKNTVSTFIQLIKAGIAWDYDSLTIAYDGPTDSVTGYTVYYDSLNATVTYTNTTKNPATATNLAKS